VPPGVTPSPEVTVDGQPVPVVLLDNDRPTDPGPHHIVARQAGMAAEADVSLAEGQVRPVSLRLGGAGAGAAVAAAGGTPDPYGAGVVAAPPPPSPTPSTSPPGAPWTAFEFGARLAFGLPFGSAVGGNGNDLNHTVSNMIAPIWLDAGVRFLSNWYAGAYFAYGLTSLANQFVMGACNQPGFGCSSNDIRLGVNAHYHVFPDGAYDPWFGVGFGYEWFSATETADAAHSPTGTAATASNGVAGWEFVNLQGGLDFRLLKGALGVGPFVTVTIDQYNHVSSASDNNGGTTGSSITNQSLHEWFLFGVRGDYDLKF
jgi:hypothetical protein